MNRFEQAFHGGIRRADDARLSAVENRQASSEDATLRAATKLARRLDKLEAAAPRASKGLSRAALEALSEKLRAESIERSRSIGNS